ncbi:MAG: DegT/DnrJ/EryC1/StrS family aminotransferase [Methanomicrobiaceae archaeon]|nr:DegT/DnrJ/EryC1/StrS family aminotransferase [Methanomicrobiaceae archaeon]
MTINRSIQFAKPWITNEEREAVLEVLKGDILTHGPQNAAFEKEFGEFTGGDNTHCAAMSSCMAALHISYWQMGIGAGDEVIVAAQTHVATGHAAEVVGAKCLFADCDPLTGNIDPDKLESLITPKTKAIGLVHFLGIPCEMDAIMDIANTHDLKVIEDCALAVGSTFKGKHVGLFGDTGCFSFYPVKHLTTGDGGMFITRHKELAEKVIKARAFGVDRNYGDRQIPGMYDVPTLGINYRMSDINASIGRVQLKRIDEILKRRKENFKYLKKTLSEIPDLAILDSQHKEAENSHYCLSVVLDGVLSKRRNDVINSLKEKGIGTSVYYPQPVPRMTYYKNKYGYDSSAYPNAERISDQSIALPVGPHLNTDDMGYMAGIFAETLKEMRI